MENLTTFATQLKDNWVFLLVAALVVIAVFILSIKGAKEGASVHLGKDGFDFGTTAKPKKEKEKKKNPAEQIQASQSMVIESLIAIVNFQTVNQQEEWEEIDNLKRYVLSSQLDFLDLKWKAHEVDLEAYFKNGKDKTAIMYSMLSFENMYDGFRKTIVEVIKKNHLAQKSEQTLEEEMEARVKTGINYMKSHLDSFPTLESPESFISEYTRVIDQVTKDSISNARQLAIDRISKEGKIHEEHLKERNEYLSQYLKSAGLTEEQVKVIIAKTNT